MALTWVKIGNLKGPMGPAGDAASLGRFEALDSRIDAFQARDIIYGQDSRALRTVSSPTYAVPITDMDGYVAGGVQSDGVFNFEKPPRVLGHENTTLHPLTSSEWAIPFTDKDGYVAGGIRPDGTAEFFKMKSAGMDAKDLANTMVGMTRSSRRRIFTPGDSLTNGYFGGSSGHTADAWPAKLQALVPTGVQVVNVSTSGWTVDEEAARIGALPMPITVVGGQIPASGTVAVTSTAVIGWAPGARGIPGSLAGVPGWVNRPEGGTALVFSRTTAGTATPVPAGTLFVPDFAGHEAETAVIMLGRNDVAYNVTGAEASVAEHVVAGIKRIVDWLSPDIKQVLLLGVTTSAGETRGTAGHTTVTEINRRLSVMYPTRFFDLRQYLVDQAIYDLGITPTAADRTKMAADTLPPSIMDPGAAGTGDGTHYSKATATLVAARINDFLSTRGWV